MDDVASNVCPALAWGTWSGANAAALANVGTFLGRALHSSTYQLDVGHFEHFCGRFEHVFMEFR